MLIPGTGYETQTVTSELPSGSREAFGMLYSRYAPMLLGYFDKVAGDRANAEKLLQQVYLQMWNDRDSLNETTGSLFGWMFSRAKEVAAQYFRENNIEKQIQPAAEIVNIKNGCGGELCMQIFELVYYYNRSLKEVASLVNVSESEVRTMLRSAVCNLKTLQND